jgi:hypothetical protein
MFNWIHIINSEDDYENLWNNLIKFDELHLGRFIIINGSLSCKDGRVFGNEGDIIAGITTYTYEKETMEGLINMSAVDSSMLILYEDLEAKELDLDAEISKRIRKEIKDFKKPSKFENYLRSVNYKDFRFEDFSKMEKVGPAVTRKSALKWERENIKKYKKNHGGTSPKYND